MISDPLLTNSPNLAGLALGSDLSYSYCDVGCRNDLEYFKQGVDSGGIGHGSWRYSGWCSEESLGGPTAENRSLPPQLTNLLLG